MSRRNSQRSAFPDQPLRGAVRMEEVIAKDISALKRQLQMSNPECKASHGQSLDISKHVKNLSVRYVSTIMPTAHNLDDWITLPLFQHGQDIPIDNDGRTAILVAHVPSLEHLLEAWRERMANERISRKERRRQQKAEKRESARQKRTEQRKSKQSSRKGPTLMEPESKARDQTASPACNENGINYGMCVVKKEEPCSDYEYNVPYPNYDSSVKDFGTLDDSLELDDANALDCGPPLGYDLDSCSNSGDRILDFDNHDGDKEEAVGEDWTRPRQEQLLFIKQEPDEEQEEPPAPKKMCLAPSFEQGSAPVTSMETDDSDALMEMEQQIETIRMMKQEIPEETAGDMNNEIRMESDHAALNLEKELNGEPVECKKFTETLLRVEPSRVEIDPFPTSTADERSTSKSESKKNSASSKIKHSLLQRMTEGREVDVDTTSAVALESDYKNTFCYLCRIDFNSSKGLYLHNVKLHSEGEVQCDVCYKPLKNRITLMKHKKLHLGAEDMHCLCTECGRPFKDKRALTAHVTYTKHMLGISAASGSS